MYSPCFDSAQHDPAARDFATLSTRWLCSACFDSAQHDPAARDFATLSMRLPPCVPPVPAILKCCGTAKSAAGGNEALFPPSSLIAYKHRFFGEILPRVSAGAIKVMFTSDNSHLYCICFLLICIHVYSNCRDKIHELLHLSQWKN